MNNITIGTAGHIDHGKTALIKTLTGIDTDRLKDEKARGITIDLGFANIKTKDTIVGFVDVPGHEKFIKNMVAGIKGIDAVMLVISADEGIMPQSIEHFNILNLMGIEKGFVVISKIDLVDEELILVVEEEIKELIKGTFLENCEIIKASSKTKEGIKEIKDYINIIATENKRDLTIENPRMSIDRVFSLKGIGTVVTGTLSNGILLKDDIINIYPEKKESTIRNMQVFNKDVEKVYSGQRTAINLRDINKEDIKRGNELAIKNTMLSTDLIECKVSILENIERVIKHNSRLHLHVGTRELLCRINLIDKKEAKPGETVYVTLHTEEKINVKRLDKFILRFFSPLETIGGGIIIEPSPINKKKIKLNTIKQKDSDKLGDYITETLLLHEGFLDLEVFIKRTIFKYSYLERKLIELEKNNKIKNYKTNNNNFSIHKKTHGELIVKILNYLVNNEKENNLTKGVLKEEIKNIFFNNIDKSVFNSFIDEMIEVKTIKSDKNYLTTYEFKLSLTKEQEKFLEKFKTEFKSKDKNLLNLKKIKEDTDIKIILDYLLFNEKIIEVAKDYYILKEDFKEIKNKLIKYLEKNNQITVVQFKDLIDGNRKNSIMLLEYFDSLKITKRIDDYRILYNF